MFLARHSIQLTFIVGFPVAPMNKDRDWSFVISAFSLQVDRHPYSCFLHRYRKQDLYKSAASKSFSELNTHRSQAENKDVYIMSFRIEVIFIVCILSNHGKIYTILRMLTRIRISLSKFLIHKSEDQGCQEF